MKKMIYTHLCLLISLSVTAPLADVLWQDDGHPAVQLAAPLAAPLTRAEHLILAELSVEKDNLRPGITLDAAVEEVRRETSGRILSAKTEQENGQIIHRIKVLTPDAHVQVYRIRADKE